MSSQPPNIEGCSFAPDRRKGKYVTVNAGVSNVTEGIMDDARKVLLAAVALHLPELVWLDIL
jgi:hypothetical protein